MATPEQPQRIELELSEGDRPHISLVRAVSTIALETGQLIVTHSWPRVLELKCAPYPGREVIPAYPPEAFPEFKTVRQSERLYNVTTKMPFITRHSSSPVIGANSITFYAEAPPPEEWGWRLSRFAIQQLYWCEPERTPATGEHDARKALELLSLQTTKLRKRESLIPNWPVRWMTTP